MKVSKRSLFVLILVAVLVASCAPTVAETPDINASLTAGVSTFAAYFFQTQTAMAPPATETFTPSPSPTITPVSPTSLTASPTALVFFPVLATSTFAPVVTITGTNYTRTATPVAYGCNNLQLIRTDGPTTPLAINRTFTMEWKVQNTGTCTWTFGYHLEFVSGNSMNGAPQSHNQILAGNTATLKVSMTTPSTAGTYTSTWQMADGSGHRFGSLLSVTVDVRTTYP